MTPGLPPRFLKTICAATGASSIVKTAPIQNLWSGYGQILRLTLDDRRSVIAKHIHTPLKTKHPRGWNSDLSHQRKLRSYQVESAWYQNWSHLCPPESRIPKLLACDQAEGETLLVLEDLDAVGFPARLNSISPASLTACLDWLAHFHAAFMGAQPTDLWETGTYWHLATRSEELAALDDLPLKEAASKIDQLLSGARYQTLVHGDAKLANFCFSPSGNEVAAVDFQYLGGGCGMKDLAYFIGSCLDETECQKQDAEILHHYFTTLHHALRSKQPNIDPHEVESEWRALYPVAWTDFHRFLKGWSPGHWKLNSYSEDLARQVIGQITFGIRTDPA